MFPEQTFSLYLVTNRVNGKQYVGFTSRKPAARWREHRKAARSGSVLVFHRALRKYGVDQFDWQVIAEARTEVDAKEAEVLLIEQKTPAYNMTRGGDAGPILTEEQRVRRCVFLHRLRQDPEVQSRRLEASRLAQRTPECRKRRAAVSQNMWAKPEHIQKMKRVWSDPVVLSRVSQARQAAKGCGVGPRKKKDKLVPAVLRAGVIRRQNPLWKQEQSAATRKTWTDKETRARREYGLQQAAKKVDQKAKGRKIAHTKRVGRARKAFSSFEMNIHTWPDDSVSSVRREVRENGIT